MTTTQDAPLFIPEARLPRADLMPPEFAARRRERRIQAGLAGAVVAAIAVVVALYAGAVHGEHDAQDSLDAANAQHARLQQQLTKLDDVQRAYDQESAREAMLKQAMAPEIRWSDYLAGLSLRIPTHVWLTNMTVAENVDDSNQVSTSESAGSGSSGSGDSTSPGGIGSITFAGTAYHHDDVASWLESLSKERGYADPYFSNSTKSKIGGKDAVNFSSTVNLTKDALCGPTCGKLEDAK